MTPTAWGILAACVYVPFIVAVVRNGVRAHRTQQEFRSLLHLAGRTGDDE